MGGSQSSEFSSSEIQEFRKFYTLVKTSYDYRFGSVSIYQNNESRQLVLVNTRNFDSNNERNEFVNELRRRQLLQHPSVAKIIGYSLESGTNICGITQQVTIYTEFYQDDLLRELRARQRSGERYTEQEVWYLLETLVSSLAFLQEQNSCHGDITPQNVILTNNGQAKILNNGLVSLYKNNFVRRLQGQTNVYLSPEALDLVQAKYISPQYNIFKSDVYSLGVTLLYVCLLQDPSSLYNFTQNRVYHEQVDGLLNQVLANYSYQLTDLIRQMLMQDPAKRPSAVELRGMMGTRPVLNQSRVIAQPQPLVSQPLMMSQPLVSQPLVQQPVGSTVIQGSTHVGSEVQQVQQVQQVQHVQAPFMGSSHVVQQPFVQAPFAQQTMVRQSVPQMLGGPQFVTRQ